MLNLILKIFSILIMVLFSVICFAPAYRLSTPIVDEFGLVGLTRGLFLAYVWCAVCGGSMAIIGFFPAVAAGRSVRGLWGRIAAIGILIVTVAASALPSKTRVAVELADFLVTSCYKETKGIKSPLEIFISDAEGAGSGASQEALNGLVYLQEKRDAAIRRLRVNRVTARSKSGEKVADLFGGDYALAFVAAEHLSEAKLGISTASDQDIIVNSRVSESTRQQLMADFLRRVNRERGQAFCNVVSGDGARGLGQIIPGCFLDIARLYPRAGLSKSAGTGVCDPVQVFMFIALYRDDALTQVPNKVEARMKSVSFQNRFAVAAYNSGPNAAWNAVSGFGLNWRSNHGKSGLSYETRMLVKKYIWVEGEIARLLDLLPNS